jgi:hypothetical protein
MAASAQMATAREAPASVRSTSASALKSTGTVVAPASKMPKNAIGQAGWFLPTRSTRSPGFTPACRRRSAVARARPRSAR